jgi:hypothetical protein
MKSLLEMEKRELADFLNGVLERIGSKKIMFTVTSSGFFSMVLASKDSPWGKIFYASWDSVKGVLLGKKKWDITLKNTCSRIWSDSTSGRGYWTDLEPADLLFLKTVRDCLNLDELRVRLDLVS